MSVSLTFTSPAKALCQLHKFIKLFHWVVHMVQQRAGQRCQEGEEGLHPNHSHRVH